jgi:uncharacterized protein
VLATLSLAFYVELSDTPTENLDVTVGTFLASSLGLWTGFVLAAAFVSQRHGSGDLVDDLRVRFRGVDVALGIVAGLGSQLVLVPLLYWPLDRWLNLDELDDPARDLADAAQSAPAFVLIVIGVAIVAPIVEELFFRGVLLPALAERFGDAAGIVGSSVIFALFHFEPVAMPGLLVVGLVFALLVHRTGRLGPAIVAHIAFNAVVAVTLAADR